MITLILTYVVLGFGAVVALAAMILRIGTMMADCPEAPPGARAATVAAATGYGAIGAGGVLLVGTIIPLAADAPLLGFFAAIGFACLCLGVGFAQAINTMRVVLRPAAKIQAA